ncbi:hypothetical protein AZF37_09190 [endosymbiont 'TC1' of Trimyema compressum]|uniref:endonuclease NucS domain-containing protein n=1 Tax=endosymbiont 'TC1' of Trimyema compressum TaxID=243899 RepID=UPI0007F0568B|nr:endonuclease NucS domain-containing protein [endosymbiont 'TC1' of Trimyema compressum]AMP21294.1 hypothetical protein AZF37_09190 [endosymbiont 'TC1' of Trimyema compressum]
MQFERIRFARSYFIKYKQAQAGLDSSQKEQYIPNKFGTRGFVDLYAKNEFGEHVIIEIKRSNSASREALHEVNKYVESIKQHFGVKDAEIHVIIASTEWGELLVPFSRFSEDTTIPLQGYKIIVSDDGSDFFACLLSCCILHKGVLFLHGMICTGIAI